MSSTAAEATRGRWSLDNPVLLGWRCAIALAVVGGVLASDLFVADPSPGSDRALFSTWRYTIIAESALCGFFGSRMFMWWYQDLRTIMEDDDSPFVHLAGRLRFKQRETLRGTQLIKANARAVVVYVLLTAVLTYGVAIWSWEEIGLNETVIRRRELWLALQACVASFAAIPAVLGLRALYVIARNSKYNDRWSARDAPISVLEYRLSRRRLRAILASIGALVTVTVINAGLFVAVTESKPAEAAPSRLSPTLLVGIVLTVQMAFIYLPAHDRLEVAGEELVDRLFPLGKSIDKSELDNRAALRSELGIGVASRELLEGATIVLGPIISALLATIGLSVT